MPPTLRDTLRDSDWTPDGLGETDLVPALLGELLDLPSKRRVRTIAVELGEERLVHQGWVMPVAAVAAPVLIELLGWEALESREDLLVVLARITAGVPERHWATAVRGPDALGVPEGDSDAPALAARTAASRRVAAGTRTYVGLLQHRRVLLRTAAALLLALLPPNENTRAGIVGALREERDERARFGLYVVLASWHRAFGEAIEPELLAGAEAGPLAELGRAIARAWISAPPDETTRNTLVQAVFEPPGGFDPRKNLPIDTAHLALEAVRTAFPAELSTIGPRGVRQGLWSAQTAVAMLLNLDPTVSRWRHLPPIDRFEPPLRDFLRQLADALPAKPSIWLGTSLARATGLPSDRDEFRRWAGVDPPGPMEVEIAGPAAGMWESRPAYAWYRAAALGELSHDQLVRILADHPSDVGLGAVVLAAVSSPYDLYYAGSWTWDDVVQTGIAALGRRPGAVDALEPQVLAAPNLWSALMLVTARHRLHAARGEILDSRYDLLVRASCENRAPLTELAREVVAGLPPDRRDALLLDLPLPTSIEIRPTMWNHPVQPRLLGWAFLDLAADRTTAAQRIVESIAGWQSVPRPGSRHPTEEAIRLLTALGAPGRDAIRKAPSDASAEGRAILDAALVALA